MSSQISELIERVQQENRLRIDEYKKQDEEQQKKYTEMIDRITRVKDEALEYEENIEKNLKVLIDNKHTIEKHVQEQTESLEGIPIAFEKHQSVIELFSNVAEFINNTESIITPESVCPEKIRVASIKAAENVTNDLKEYSSEVVQARDLLEYAKLMKNLLESADEDKFDKSLNTILEDS